MMYPSWTWKNLSHPVEMPQKVRVKISVVESCLPMYLRPQHEINQGTYAHKNHSGACRSRVSSNALRPSWCNRWRKALTRGEDFSTQKKKSWIPVRTNRKISICWTTVRNIVVAGFNHNNEFSYRSFADWISYCGFSDKYPWFIAFLGREISSTLSAELFSYSAFCGPHWPLNPSLLLDISFKKKERTRCSMISMTVRIWLRKLTSVITSLLSQIGQKFDVLLIKSTSSDVLTCIRGWFTGRKIWDGSHVYLWCWCR